MSKTYIDFFETLKGEFIASLKFKNKFVRLWGTTVVDGVEVLNKKFVVYPGLSSPNVKKFLKLIGSENAFEGQKFKGVKKYYFYLNATKVETLSDSNIRASIAGKINTYIGIGNSSTVALTFTDDGTLDFRNMTRQQMIDYVVSDYDVAFNRLHSVVGDYLLDNAIGEYLLFDANQHFSYSVLNVTASSVPYYEKNTQEDYEYANYSNKVTRYKSSILIEIKFTQNSHVTGTSNIINGIIDERVEYKEARLQSLLESDGNVLITDDWMGENTKNKTDAVWYKGYMRKSFVDDTGIKTKEKCRVLVKALDTGYSKKDASFFSKIIGPVLIIAAIVLAIPSGGLTLEALPAFLGALAVNVGIATLVLVGLQVYFNNSGESGSASYMGRWVKIGGVISTIAGIGAMLANLTRMAGQEAAKQAAQEAMVQGGATSIEATLAVGSMDAAQIASFNAANSVVVEVGVGSFVGAAKNMFVSSITGSWKSMISTGMKVFRMASEFITKNRMEAMQSETNTIVDEANKVNEELADLQDKEINIGLENIKTYTSSLTIDNVRFQVDYLYEGTKMNIGRPSFHSARGHNIISDDIYDVNKI